MIRTYIFDNDDVAESIGRLLRRRAEEGVEVKILLDGLGTIVATGAADESMPEDYVAPESVRRFLEEGSKIDVRQGKNPWLVSGDHVKTTIIDNETVFTGGMNIGREYRYVWHDMMMEAQGPVVDIIHQEFRDAWSHAGPLGDVGYFFHKIRPGTRYAQDTGYPVRALFTKPGNPLTKSSLHREAHQPMQGCFMDYVRWQATYRSLVFVSDAMPTHRSLGYWRAAQN